VSCPAVSCCNMHACKSGSANEKETESKWLCPAHPHAEGQDGEEDGRRDEDMNDEEVRTVLPSAVAPTRHFTLGLSGGAFAQASPHDHTTALARSTVCDWAVWDSICASRPLMRQTVTHPAPGLWGKVFRASPPAAPRCHLNARKPSCPTRTGNGPGRPGRHRRAAHGAHAGNHAGQAEGERATRARACVRACVQPRIVALPSSPHALARRTLVCVPGYAFTCSILACFWDMPLFLSQRFHKPGCVFTCGICACAHACVCFLSLK